MATRRPPLHKALAPAYRAAAVVLDGIAPAALNTGVLVAVSGGPDSALLLATLQAHAVRRRFPLQAVHVNHGLSPAAKDLQHAAVTLCQSLDVTCQVESVDVAVAGHEGIEAAARRARHAAFHRTLQRTGLGWLALGHNATDAAETLLQRLLEGAGRGQAALPAVDKPKLRPLIALTRLDVRHAVAALQLPTQEDPMNGDATMLRAWMRETLWPVLTQRFPAADRTLARAANLAGHDHAALEDAAAGAWGPGPRASRRALTALPQAVRTRALRQMLEAAAGEPVRTGREAVEKTARALEHNSRARRLFKAGKVWLVVEGEEVRAQCSGPGK